MKHSDYKLLIEKRIEWINDILGTEYRTDFVSFYGGWNLYIRDVNGGHSHGKYGFDYRKSNKEMVAYLDGLWMGLTYGKY